MWTLIKGFFGGISAKVFEIAAIIGGLLAAVFAIYSAGKKSEKADELQKVGTEVKEANDVQNKNSMRPDGAAAGELRTDWSR